MRPNPKHSHNHPRSPYAARRAAQRASLIETRARCMRFEPTEAERILWGKLRASQLGVVFRRQLPVGGFVADFAAPSARLIVEVDGLYHARRQSADSRRDAKLRRQGWRILRLPEELVRCQLAVAVARVAAALRRPPG